MHTQIEHIPIFIQSFLNLSPTINNKQSQRQWFSVINQDCDVGLLAWSNRYEAIRVVHRTPVWATEGVMIMQYICILFLYSNKVNSRLEVHRTTKEVVENLWSSSSCNDKTQKKKEKQCSFIFALLEKWTSTRQRYTRLIKTLFVSEILSRTNAVDDKRIK